MRSGRTPDGGSAHSCGSTGSGRVRCRPLGDAHAFGVARHLHGPQFELGICDRTRALRRQPRDPGTARQSAGRVGLRERHDVFARRRCRLRPVGRGRTSGLGIPGRAAVFPKVGGKLAWIIRVSWWRRPIDGGPPRARPRDLSANDGRRASVGFQTIGRFSRSGYRGLLRTRFHRASWRASEHVGALSAPGVAPSESDRHHQGIGASAAARRRTCAGRRVRRWGRYSDDRLRSRGDIPRAPSVRRISCCCRVSGRCAVSSRTVSASFTICRAWAPTCRNISRLE